jgi:hypothetical protein
LFLTLSAFAPLRENSNLRHAMDTRLTPHNAHLEDPASQAEAARSEKQPLPNK